LPLMQGTWEQSILSPRPHCPFGLGYVYGRISSEYYQMLSNAFRVRNKKDYDDFYIVSRDESEKQLNLLLHMGNLPVFNRRIR